MNNADQARADQAEPSGFADLGLADEVVNTLTGLGYDQPTPIQAQAIPHLLSGSDVLGQAATGTGKTAAFALPIVNGIAGAGAGAPVALIVVPTRELAVQVAKAVTGYGKHRRIKVVAVYGGASTRDQVMALRRGAHVVVGTPGRTIDLIKRRSLDLGEIRTVVLDEADEMLDMGFAEDIEAILESTPSSRQTALFSATMPSRIRSMAKRHQNNPVRVETIDSHDTSSKALVRHSVYMVNRRHKAAALGRIIDMESPESTIVFCRTRNDVDELTAVMNGRGYRAESLHGGMDQDQRDRVMGRLRDGTADLLVATDVAARGIDVDHLTHAVNHDVPTQPESYVHRIGRVGRAGREGVAITLAEPKDRGRLRAIERLVGDRIDVVDVPSVDQLRARRLEQTVEAVRAHLDDDLDHFQPVIDELGRTADSDDETDIRTIALAALKMLHDQLTSSSDETFIPTVAESNQKPGRDRNHRGSGRPNRHDRPGKKRSRHDADGGADRPDRSDDDTAFVYIGVGRRGKIRPGDLVGAIANETGLAGRDIGPIRIAEHYSVVGVPPSDLHQVIGAINGSSIRGRRAKARPYV